MSSEYAKGGSAKKIRQATSIPTEKQTIRDSESANTGPIRTPLSCLARGLFIFTQIFSEQKEIHIVYILVIVDVAFAGNFLELSVSCDQFKMTLGFFPANLFSKHRLHVFQNLSLSAYNTRKQRMANDPSRPILHMQESYRIFVSAITVG